MPSFLWKLKAISILSNFAFLINAQDLKTVVFPVAGNDPAFGVGNKIESTTPPDVTRPSGSLAGPTSISSKYNLPAAPQKNVFRHRSEGVPYIYEYPSLGYPVAHSIDHPIGPSPKHLAIVSFIGLLLLFAIIQNTIASVKRREALIEILSTRQKRDLHSTRDFNSVTPEQEDILNEDARVRCIQRTVCAENRKLFQELGSAGKIIAKYLTLGVKKSLESSSGWDRLVEDAGSAGFRGEDCDVLYRDCDTKISPENEEKSSILKLEKR